MPSSMLSISAWGGKIKEKYDRGNRFASYREDTSNEIYCHRGHSQVGQKRRLTEAPGQGDRSNVHIGKTTRMRL